MTKVIVMILVFSEVYWISEGQFRLDFPPGSFCECGAVNRLRYSYLEQTKTEKKARIVGGSMTQPHRYPWMAYILKNGTLLCGASIISRTFVLSAAHCFTIGYDISSLRIVVGEHDRCTRVSPGELGVRRVFLHPLAVDSTNFDYDLAALRMSSPLTFSPTVRPICLPSFDVRDVSSRKYVGQNALVVGWGTQESGGTAVCTLREVKVTILPRTACEDVSSVAAAPSPLASSALCAGGRRRDACQGDSGGPLALQKPSGALTLIGVVSSGAECGARAGRYADVRLMMPWVLRVAGRLSCF